MLWKRLVLALAIVASLSVPALAAIEGFSFVSFPWIAFALIVAMFLSGCLWRATHYGP
jgi:hypothetical protein